MGITIAVPFLGYSFIVSKFKLLRRKTPVSSSSMANKKKKNIEITLDNIRREKTKLIAIHQRSSALKNRSFLQIAHRHPLNPKTYPQGLSTLSFHSFSQISNSVKHQFTIHIHVLYLYYYLY